MSARTTSGKKIQIRRWRAIAMRASVRKRRPIAIRVTRKRNPTNRMSMFTRSTERTSSMSKPSLRLSCKRFDGEKSVEVRREREKK